MNTQEERKSNSEEETEKEEQGDEEEDENDEEEEIQSQSLPKRLLQSFLQDEEELEKETSSSSNDFEDSHLSEQFTRHSSLSNDINTDDSFFLNQKHTNEDTINYPSHPKQHPLINSSNSQTMFPLVSSQKFASMDARHFNSSIPNWMNSTPSSFEVVFGEESTLPSEIMNTILLFLTNVKDLSSVSCVCKSWRMAAMDAHQLRSWTLDDDIRSTVGFTSSMVDMHAMNLHPSDWVNPTIHSPFASFHTPLSLQKKTNFFKQIACEKDKSSDTSSDFQIQNWIKSRCFDSPKTPSPLKEEEKEKRNTFDILKTIKSVMLYGNFLGEIDVRSSRITDEMLQLVLSTCPRLLTFRIQHTCAMIERRMHYPSFSEELALSSADMSFLLLAECPAGCSFLSFHAFSNVSSFCPFLKSLTLVLQHIKSSRELFKILSSISSFPNLETLCIELRLPTFVKNELKWIEVSGFDDECMYSLIDTNSFVLKAFSINYFKCSLSTLRNFISCFQQIQALDIEGLNISCEMFKILQVLPNLVALALSKFEIVDKKCLHSCKFKALKRLRIGTLIKLKHHLLFEMMIVFPSADSLHLLWGSKLENEVHFSPLGENAIQNFDATS